MNSRNIKKHLNAKIKDWLESIDDEHVKQVIKDNAIITGGALVSLLTGEKPNDYDVYFKTKQAVIDVANYYVYKWNSKHSDKTATVMVDEDETLEVKKPSDDPLYSELTVKEFVPGRVQVFIQSVGVAGEEPDFEDDAIMPDGLDIPKEDEKKPKYSPVFLSSNAITLSNKIQVVVRFYGDINEIHKNYDFAHCTCAWSMWDNNLNLPNKALECIINKELYYIGSKYPLCSIIRTRKYLERGYHINAGQYVKMAMQLNSLDLNNIKTLEDQLTGVDTWYFQTMINELSEKHANDGKVDSCYVIELINKLF